MDIATRAWSPEIRGLLLELLNEANDGVLEAHESVAGKKMLKDKGPKEEPEGLAVFEDELPRPKRQKRNPKLLIESEDYTRDFTPVNLSDTETSGSEAMGTDYNVTDEDPDVEPDIDMAKDEEGGFRLQSRSTKAIREIYAKIDRKQKEAFDQDEIVLQHLLSLDPYKAYIDSDLDDQDILDRALRLLFRAPFGQEKEYVRISPHIRYDQLHKDVINQIRESMKLSDQHIMYLRAVAAEGKAGPESIHLGSC
ncbi:MAG: hypothetical protein Q9213_001973 [Squamulea squamosa]